MPGKYKVRFVSDGKSVTEDVIFEGEDPRPQAARILNQHSVEQGELLKWCGNHWGTLEVFDSNAIRATMQLNDK